MSIFSSLMWSGTAFYGDPFAPIIDTIQDWGWSLLPQFPGSQRERSGSASVPQPSRPQPVSVPPIPVVYEDPGGGIESETTWVRTVLPGPAGSGVPRVPTEIVVVEGLPTEVERYENGDFPAGSIFAPGRAWGGGIHELDREEPEVEEMAFSDILDWGLTTLTGQQPWQIQPFGGGIGGTGPIFAAQQIPSSPIPGGYPALPPSAAGGMKVTANGDTCGNRRYVTLDRETGKISCKRRRRRRLLTNRDLADLASLKTITGGGAALNAAVIRAVR